MVRGRDKSPELHPMSLGGFLPHVSRLELGKFFVALQISLTNLYDVPFVTTNIRLNEVDKEERGVEII